VSTRSPDGEAMASGMTVPVRNAGPAFSLLEPEAVNFESTWRWVKSNGKMWLPRVVADYRYCLLVFYLRSLLESSLLSILRDIGSGFPNDLWVTLYTGVYKLCTRPMGQQMNFQLYSRLKNVSFVPEDEDGRKCAVLVLI
jgi:hypothetical protein